LQAKPGNRNPSSHPQLGLRLHHAALDQEELYPFLAEQKAFVVVELYFAAFAAADAVVVAADVSLKLEPKV
jgi:hypothetical protein